MPNFSKTLVAEGFSRTNSRTVFSAVKLITSSSRLGSRLRAVVDVLRLAGGDLAADDFCHGDNRTGISQHTAMSCRLSAPGRALICLKSLGRVDLDRKSTRL